MGERNSIQHYFLIASFSLVAMLPMYLWGVPGGNDRSQHYQFAWTVYNSVKSGDLYPSFAPDTNYGFGDYGLRFYPPATYYVLAGLRTVTGDWYLATLAALTGIFVLGALGSYLWTRELFDERTALVAAAVYTFLPYHLNEIYNNGLLAEFFATAVLPFCFLFLERTLRRPDIKNALLLSVACSLLVLTHLPTTLMGGAAMAVYAVFLIDRRMIARQFGCVAMAAVTTATMTAFYWARWVPELAWITHNSEKYFSTTWDYRTNFLLLPSRWSSAGTDFLNLWLADLMLAAAVFVVIPAVIVTYLDRERRKRSLPLIVGFILAAILATPLSRPLWDYAAALQKLQFPWRWLTIISVFGSVLGAMAIVRVAAKTNGRWRPLVLSSTAFGLVSVVALGVLIVRGPAYSSRGELNAEIATFGDSTGCDCWWPIWANGDAFKQTARVDVGRRAVTVESWNGSKLAFSLAAGVETSAAIRAWYYPRWRASANGRPINVTADSAGALNVELSKDAETIHLEFVEPVYVRAATMISIVVWILVIFTAIALLVKSRRRISPASPTS